MSREKEIEKELVKLLKVKSLDLMMYTAVRSIRHCLPGATIKESIYNFMDVFELSEDEYKIENALVTYNRINKEIKEIGLWKMKY